MSRHRATDRPVTTLTHADRDADFWGLTHTQRRHHLDRVWNYHWRHHLDEYRALHHVLSVAGWVFFSCAAVLGSLLGIAVILTHLSSGG